jgi:hypothetical protein
MMGTKIRSFSPLPDDLSLEDLVPQDHFYRRLEATLDLSFVIDLVGPLYARAEGPPSTRSSSSSCSWSCSSRTSGASGSSYEWCPTASRCAGTWATTCKSLCPTTPP